MNTKLTLVGENYFIGSKVASLLGWKKNTEAYDRISDQNKIFYKNLNEENKASYLSPNDILISKDGIRELYSYSLNIPKESYKVLESLKIINNIEIKKTLTKEQTLKNNRELIKYSDKSIEDYFIGYQIADLLGYKNHFDSLQKVSDKNKIFFKDYNGIKNPIINSKTILITKNGVLELMSKTNEKNIEKAVYILKMNGIEIKTIKHPIIKNQKIEECETYNVSENNLTQYSYISQPDKLYFEYFIGYEIAALLGYKYCDSTVKNNVSKSNQLLFKDYPGIKYPNINPKTILITREGAIEMLLKTKKRITPDVDHLLKKFGIEITNKKCLSKEQLSLSAITNALKTEVFEDQVKVGDYYIDLYFPTYRIPVECDENGHKDRKPGAERERMDYINKELMIDDSHWIRFNPDEEKFDISKVIGKIILLIKTKGVWKRKYIRPVKGQKNINLDPEKPCTKCGIIKKLEEFNKARDHRDGRENYCKDCKRKRQQEILKEKMEKIEEQGGLKELTCNICNKTKEIDQFYRDTHSSTQHMRKCGECHRKKLKKKLEKEKVIPEEKVCTYCKLTKKIDEFNKVSCAPSGYCIYCKSCAKIRRKNYSDKIKATEELILAENPAPLELVPQEQSSHNELMCSTNSSSHNDSISEEITCKIKE